MEITLKQLISTYLNKGKDELDRRLNRIRQKGISSETLLKILMRPKNSIEEFLKKEQEILPLVSKCQSWEEVEAFAYKAFGGIKGISDDSINSWTWKQVDILDLDREANCLSCVSLKLRNDLTKKQISEEQLVHCVKQLSKEFEQFNNLDVANFITYANKKKMLRKILPKS